MKTDPALSQSVFHLWLSSRSLQLRSIFSCVSTHVKTYSSSRIPVFDTLLICLFPAALPSAPSDGCSPGASYCEEFLRQYTCWLLRSHSSQQPAKTLPEKHSHTAPVSCWCVPRVSALTVHGWFCAGDSTRDEENVGDEWLGDGISPKVTSAGIPP